MPPRYHAWPRWFPAKTRAGARPSFVGDLPHDPGARRHQFFTRAPKIRAALKRFGADVVFAPYLISNGVAAAIAWQGPLVVAAVGADVVEQAGTVSIPPLARKVLVRALSARSAHIYAVADEMSEAMTRMGCLPRRSTVFRTASTCSASPPALFSFAFSLTAWL